MSNNKYSNKDIYLAIGELNASVTDIKEDTKAIPILRKEIGDNAVAIEKNSTDIKWMKKLGGWIITALGGATGIAGWLGWKK